MVLEALAEQQPLVLIVKDAHWADGATANLLTFHARNLRHAPLLPLLAGLGRVDGVQRLELATSFA